LPFRPRSGRNRLQALVAGAPGSPDNFELSIVRDRRRLLHPSSRHNFDQVRLCLDGKMNYAPEDLLAGDFGYFPESTHYGRRPDATGSLVLLLQMGGSTAAAS